MFLTAAKLTIVEALRDVFDAIDYVDKPKPRRIDIEYPEEHDDWPAILVQLRIDQAGWTGIMPDEEVNLADQGDTDHYPPPDDPQAPWSRFREGQFTGSIDLTILSLSSEARDRFFDTLTSLFLAGRLHPVMKRFYDRIETGEVVGLTVQEGTVQPLGDSVGIGTPWGEEAVTYEASIRIGCVGMFYFDNFTQSLAAITSVQTHQSNQEEPLYDEGGSGWVEFS